MLISSPSGSSPAEVVSHFVPLPLPNRHCSSPVCRVPLLLTAEYCSQDASRRVSDSMLAVKEHKEPQAKNSRVPGNIVQQEGP